MPTFLVGGLVLIVLVLGWWFMRNRTNLQSSESEFNLDAWQPRTVRPLTKIELDTLARIKSVVPDCLVFPQVSLSRFLRVKSSLPYGPWFRSVGRRCVDFLVCSPKGDVLGVIELIDNKNPAPQPSRGTQAKERTLTLASIPVWHIDPESPNALDQIHDYIYAELGDSVRHPAHAQPWHPTDTAPRGAGIEAVELDDTGWYQPWPSKETRPTAYLDLLDESPFDGSKPPQ